MVSPVDNAFKEQKKDCLLGNWWQSTVKPAN